jgi:hypothetical protein
MLLGYVLGERLRVLRSLRCGSDQVIQSHRSFRMTEYKLVGICTIVVMHA